MEISPLDKNLGKEVVQLFFETFKASENEEEAVTVSGLVEKYLKNYPRKELKGFAATDRGRLVGCVFFSKLNFPASERQAFLLSPMAVKTDAQGKGIGQSLILFGHKALRKEGAQVALTYGDVRFYSKSGYQQVSEESIAAPFTLSYPEGWLACALDSSIPLSISGPSQCIPELADPRLW